MNFTISDCISRINQALNYPAISYDDVSHFFDQAIAELNTSLRIALPTVTEMRLEHTFKVSDDANTTVISTDDAKKSIPCTNDWDFDVSNRPNVYYYVDENNYLNNVFYVKTGTDTWEPRKHLYAMTNIGTAYVAIPVAFRDAVWREIPLETISEFSLTEYLPVDWLILFVIPYVCFKFSVRNGDNGALFSDEMTQGFQQLQTSYNVPNEVVISTVAHLPAYRKIAEENLNNLRAKTVTRAITSDMRIKNSIKAVYGGGLFENGGWGI